MSDLRGFDDTEEHDQVILDNLGSAPRPGDAVWVLGDISCGPREHEDRAIGLPPSSSTPPGSPPTWWRETTTAATPCTAGPTDEYT